MINTILGSGTIAPSLFFYFSRSAITNVFFRKAPAI